MKHPSLPATLKYPRADTPTSAAEEFALLEVAYTVSRVVQVFPRIEVPPGEARVDAGQEKQTLTLVVASAEGCVVLLKS